MGVSSVRLRSLNLVPSGTSTHSSPAQAYVPVAVLNIIGGYGPLTSILFVPSTILESGAEHFSDAIVAQDAGEVGAELAAQVFLNLTDALF